MTGPSLQGIIAPGDFSVLQVLTKDNFFLSSNPEERHYPHKQFIGNQAHLNSRFKQEKERLATDPI